MKILKVLGMILLFLVVMVFGASGGCFMGANLGSEKDLNPSTADPNRPGFNAFVGAIEGTILGAIGAAIALTLVLLLLRWSIARWRQYFGTES